MGKDGRRSRDFFAIGPGRTGICGERDPPARFLSAKIEGYATAQRHPRTKNHAFVFTGLRMTGFLRRSR